MLVLAVLACLVLLAGCTMPFSKGTLKVGVRSDISGFGYYNEKADKYSGLEVDIATEMAKRIGYNNVEFVTVTPESRKKMLQDSKVDALVACYSITSSREENFDFSPSYYDTDVDIMTQRSALITSINDLKGGIIGTMSGSDVAPLLVEKLKEIGFTDGQSKSANDDNTDVTFDNFQLKQYDSYKALSDALESGEVDGIAIDGAISKAYMDDTRTTLENFSIEDQHYGVATRKDSDLSSQVSSAIQSMLDDGTIASIIDSWN